jgi:hypothetical protein
MFMTMRSKRRSKRVLPEDTSPEEIDRSMEALDGPKADVLEVDGIDIVEVAPEEPQPPQLTKDELHALQLSQYQARAFEAELQLEMLKRDAYLKQVDPKGQLKAFAAFIRGRSDEAAVAKTAYAEAKKKIEERLKIDLREWAYDDQTGLLTKVDQ